MDESEIERQKAWEQFNKQFQQLQSNTSQEQEESIDKMKKSKKGKKKSKGKKDKKKGGKAPHDESLDVSTVDQQQQQQYTKEDIPTKQQ